MRAILLSQQNTRIAPRAFALALGALLIIGVGRRVVAHETPSCPVDGVGEDMTVVVPVVETPPTIDGVLAEGEWERAVKLGEFRCTAPDHGTLSTRPTTVHLMGGEGRLYVAFHCRIEDAAKLRISETREDARLAGQDRVAILLDTLHDHRRCIELAATPGGAKYDARWGNSEWDGVWQVAGAVYGDCYVIEMDVDLGSLTYERGGEKTVGANFIRYVQVPDEDTAWAVDERSTAWDWQIRKYPHLAGLLFPDRPAKQAVEADAFAVVINDWGSGGSLLASQGLDIEYPLSPAATSRFVLFPDFSEVEAAYETVDVSYREQFLPETRDFFVHQAEFFGDQSLFHSRRIGDFDYGAKMTGAYDRYRVGALDTYNPDTDRNDFVAHVSGQFGQHTDSSLSLVDVREPGFENTALAASVGTRFEEDSPWDLGGGRARSWGSDPARDGRRTNGHLGYHTRLFGADLQYDEVSPSFDPIDGFNPRQGFKTIDLNSWNVWDRKAGERLFDSIEAFGHYTRGWTSDGRFYNRAYRAGSVLWFSTLSRLAVVHTRDEHLEEDIRPEPFDDSTTMVMAEVGRSTDMYARARYTFGRVEDSKLRQFAINADWRNRSGSLQVGADYSRRRQSFFDGGSETAQIVDLNLTHVLDPEHWLSLRWYTRSGDADIDNLSLVYRIHRRSGKELFFILGDPQADQTAGKIAVKYVQPFSF
ncbi:MAG: DUF5916 domain-containing protein [Armatimonadota bacterium]|jgi:hypothetical protein